MTRQQHAQSAKKPSALHIIGFLTCVVSANTLTAEFGLIPVGPGMVATAGTWTAGMALLARDMVQDTTGQRAVLACIVVGAAISVLLTDPRLAVASAIAFTLSELVDMAVYTPLRSKGWARAALVSGAAGSAVDTTLFLAVAGFPIWPALPGQMFAKTTATIVAIAVAGVTNAVLRNRVRPGRA